MEKKPIITETTPVKMPMKQFIAFFVAVISIVFAAITYQNKDREEIIAKITKNDVEIAKINTRLYYMNLVLFGGNKIDQDAVQHKLFELELQDMNMRGGATDVVKPSKLCQ